MDLDVLYCGYFHGQLLCKIWVMCAWGYTLLKREKGLVRFSLEGKN